jgi:hypothetical protein
MNDQFDRTLDRIGAAAGLAAVILLLALFTMFPALPAPDKPIGQIAHAAATDTDSYLRAAYVGALLSGALLIFGAAVAARFRRISGGADGWSVVAMVGIASAAAVGIVSNALTITLVRAVGHGARGDSLWIGYGTDHWIGVLTAVPLAVFLLGAGLGARASGAGPRWLGWLGVALAAVFVLGAGSVMGDEVEGGIPGTVLVLGYVGLLVWIVGSSVSMLRRPASLEPAPAAALA